MRGISQTFVFKWLRLLRIRDVDSGKIIHENFFPDGFDSSGFETSTVDALFRIRPEQQIGELAKQAAKYWSQSADQVT
jgi:hypothetical protein